MTHLYNLHKDIERIDFSSAFDLYRTQEQIENRTDLYPQFFKSDLSKKTSAEKSIPRHNHHGIYASFDFDSYNPIIKTFFNLNKNILNTENNLVKKYGIDFEKTIAVWYRGTDKHAEVMLADPGDYVCHAENALRQSPESRILIQTDQKQVRDLFVDHFGEKCFFIEEMPVTEGSTGIHKMSGNVQTIGLEFGNVLLAVTHMLSKCGIVINHTGNVACWICLFRGSTEGVLQFDQEGNPVFPR